jgi:GntR family transcriptional regulator / MocR family aminotransferase
LQKQWRHYRMYMDVQNPILEQVALAKFLQTRRMDKHIRHMRRLYAEKRKTLLRVLRSEFGSAVIPWGDASGLHIALKFPKQTFNRQFSERCKNAGIRIALMSQYCVSEYEHSDKLLIGYGHMSKPQIETGIHALYQMIRDEYVSRGTM